MTSADYYPNKRCVVTGAAAGLGFALSEALLDAGASVLLADVNDQALETATQRLQRHGDRLRRTHADVTVEAEVEAMVATAVREFGRLDMIVNNAGIGGSFPFASATMEQWRRIVDLNLWSVIYGVRAALPIMLGQKSGHIVNMASIGGLVPIPYQTLYNTTKYAVVGLSETLRFEVAEDGIAVSVACPGAVATDIWGKPILGAAAKVAPPPDAIPAAEAARIVLAGVARRDGIIALPEPVRQLWRDYSASPETLEPLIWQMVRQRREMFAAPEGFVEWSTRGPATQRGARPRQPAGSRS